MTIKRADQADCLATDVLRLQVNLIYESISISSAQLINAEAMNAQLDISEHISQSIPNSNQSFSMLVMTLNYC